MPIEQHVLQRFVMFCVLHIFYIFVGLGSIRYHIALFGIPEIAILNFWKQLKFPFNALYSPPNPQESAKDFRVSTLTQGLSLAVGFSMLPIVYIAVSIYSIVKFGLLEAKFSGSEIAVDVLEISLVFTATVYFLLLGRRLLKYCDS